MFEQTIFLKMNKSSQVTIPVAMKKFLGLQETDTLTAKFRKDGTIVIARERPLEEVIDDLYTKMPPDERRRIERRKAEIKNSYASFEEYLEAENNWASDWTGDREFIDDNRN